MKRMLLAVALAAGLVDVTVAREQGSAFEGVEPAWSVEGRWSGVVGDEKSGAIYACGPDSSSIASTCVEFDLAGRKQREFSVARTLGPPTVRIAHLSRGGRAALLIFAHWHNDLRAYDVSGRLLWSYEGGGGVDDVWASDLNGDGADEVIVGYNGATGLHVLKSDGRLFWKSTDVGSGNAWHVSAGQVRGEVTPQVVSTSVDSRLVSVYSGDGTTRTSVVPGHQAFMVRVGKLSERDNAAAILVAGPGLGGNVSQLTALSAEGASRWSLELPAQVPSPVSVRSAYVAPGRPWLAVGMLGGQMHVVDLERGQIIASASDQGTRSPEVGWATGRDGGPPLLLVATGRALNAFRITRPE